MIYDNLGLSLESPQVVSVVGAGGKTSLIESLGQELKFLEQKVLSTTSTQIFKPRDMDYFFLGEIHEGFEPRNGSITSYGDCVKDGKLIGPNIKEINKLVKRQIFDYILIEADGANRKPLKVPASHEPVISKLSTVTIGLIGLDAVGNILNDLSFHRWELISQMLNKEAGEIIDSNDIVRLILHKEGTFKDSIGRKILILNKADSASRIREGKIIRSKLHREDMLVLVCNLQTKEFF